MATGRPLVPFTARRGAAGAIAVVVSSREDGAGSGDALPDRVAGCWPPTV